jgi:hypothetical protein
MSQPLFRLMLPAIQLNAELAFSAIEVHDTIFNDLLLGKPNWIAMQILIPELFLLRSHFFSQLLCMSCYMLIIRQVHRQFHFSNLHDSMRAISLPSLVFAIAKIQGGMPPTGGRGDFYVGAGLCSARASHALKITSPPHFAASSIARRMASPSCPADSTRNRSVGL